MKKFNLKRLLLMVALVIIVQNGAIIVESTTDGVGVSSEGNTAMPQSDMPDQDRPYN